MNNQECKELMLDAIIRVDVYLASQCNIPLPPSVSLASLNMTVSTFGTVAFSAALSDSAVVMLKEEPSLKVKNGRQAAGNVYTHELQVPVLVERDRAEALVQTLLGQDFHVVYTRADGSKDFSFSLPGAATCDIEESHSTATSTTLKFKILSSSQTIKLIPPSA